MYVDVNGHTDAIGSYGYYQALSERRAGAVADYLADRSVMSGRLHVEGF
ncbi:OmpA family protein [Novosphingobium sp. ES2-1]|nr:OmpA family protein [Novosphingobium sp. ES2-1]QOV96631.1 OmpA family protein [Novosphingobium sp. ES2-1]